MVDYLNAFHWFIHKEVGYQSHHLKYVIKWKLKRSHWIIALLLWQCQVKKWKDSMSNFYSISQNMGYRTLKYAERTIYNLIYVYF